MAAGVHHTDFASTVIFGADFARIRQSGLFFHRQGVKFGAQHHHRAGAVLQNAHDSGATYVLCNLITQCAQLACQSSGCAGLVRGDLGMLMQIKIEVVSVGKNRLNF